MARDLVLVLVLATETNILARRTVAVWPKASVNERDLKKTVRREAQGGRALAAFKKSRLKQEPAHLDEVAMFVEAQAEEYESFCDRYPHVDREQVSLALTTAINRRRKRTSQIFETPMGAAAAVAPPPRR